MFSGKMILATLTVIVLATAGAFAQSAKVQTAINEMREGDFMAARDAINEASQDAKTGAQAKTWYYRGSIYDQLHSSLGAEASKVKVGMTRQEFVLIPVETGIHRNL